MYNDNDNADREPRNARTWLERASQGDWASMQADMDDRAAADEAAAADEDIEAEEAAAEERAALLADADEALDG